MFASLLPARSLGASPSACSPREEVSETSSGRVSRSRETETLSSATMSLSPYERDFVLDGVDQDLRVDGRGRLDHRAMILELGTTPQASGSARLRLGDTDVMVAVKADIGTPPKAYPTHGRLSCAVELSASADPKYEGRGGEKAGAELARALERGLLGASASGAASLSAAASGERSRGGTNNTDNSHGAGAALNMQSLGIQKGKTCWALRCECLVLSADGSALDALSIAIKAALADCKIPKVTAVAGPNGGDPTELELDDDPEQCSRLDVSNVPLTVTVSRIGDAHVVDATADESAVADFAVAFAVDKNGETRGMTTTMSTNSRSHNGPGADLSSLRVMRKIAKDVCGGLHRATDAFLIAAASRTMEDDEEDGDDEDVHGEDV